MSKGWSGDNLGDFYIGAKFNIWSEERLNPAAVAVRAVAKLPTGSVDNGAGTGKFDLAFDAIVSKEASKLVDVSAYGGWEFRGQPDGYDAPGGAFRWGAGVGFPSRRLLRVTGEVNGEVPSKSTLTLQGATILCVDCGVIPLVSDVQSTHARHARIDLPGEERLLRRRAARAGTSPRSARTARSVRKAM